MTTRMEETEEQISDTEELIMENNEAEKNRERRILNHECRLRPLSDSIKYNIRIIGVPEEEERSKGGRRFTGANYS